MGIIQSRMPANFHPLATPTLGAGTDLPTPTHVRPILTFKPPARFAMPRRLGMLLQRSQLSAHADRPLPEPSGSASARNMQMPVTGTLFERLRKLGSIGIVNGGEEGDGPTPIAMDLLALGFGHNVAIACDDTPPNLLNDFPASVTNVVSTKQVGALAAADTMFLLECSTVKTIQNAKYIKPQGRVVITGAELHQVAQQVAVLKQLRPDVDIFGHAASEFALHAPSYSADPVQAAHVMAAILDGHTATMVLPLSADDAAWISAQTDSTIAPGTAIPAPFLKDGKLDRTQCSVLLASAQTGLKDAIEQLALLQDEPSATLNAAVIAAKKECADIESVRRASRAPGNTGQLVDVDLRIAALGPTVVYGANGNIGSALLKSLAGKGIPLCGVMRKPDLTFLRGFDAPQFDLVIADKVPDDFAPRTAFITASTGWAKDAAGAIIFDRSLLLSANINILAPIFKNLPASIPLVMVISNPCSEMAYLGWLVRPDLSRNLFAHAGTDVTRQMNRVKNADDRSSYGTAGPHSPKQVNWEMKPPRARALPTQLRALTDVEPSSRRGRIDPRIPLLGMLHQSRSRDKNSVTVPTAAAGIFEAINIATQAAQSYARPLTSQEATQLSELVQQYGQKIIVSEGITPTIPRDASGDIQWEMLTEALDTVPTFPEKLGVALQVMEEDRSALLHALADKINKGRDEGDKVDSDWIIAHRGPALADAISSAKK
jgi:hypothetical protein